MPPTRPPSRSTPTSGRRITKRWTLSLGSLRVQLAMGSALVAVGAIALVTLLALIGANLTVLTSQRTAIAAEAARAAQALGQGNTIFPGSASLLSGAAPPAGQAGATLTPSTLGPYLVWVMDRDGHLTVQTAIPGATSSAQDDTTIRAALLAALSGQEREDILPSSASWLSALFLSQPVSWYVALPLRPGGGRTGPITGAVALMMPSLLGQVVTNGIVDSPINLPGVGTWVILGTALVTALLAMAVAIVFARRLTHPLEHLMLATQAVRAGNYSTRAHLQRAPREIQDVIDTFNLMAATLEADIHQLQEQESQRRELLAAVAHDLATPLTMIQGYNEALADGMAHDAQQRAAATQVIGRETARLRRLVDQLRHMALVEAGIAAVRLQPVALGVLVEDTLTALTPAVAAKRLTVQAEGLEDLPPILADADWMAEILVNLLENAIRYTPAEGQITIRGGYDIQEARLQIRDSGPGIPAADYQRIFERFTRLDRARNSATGGSGLGLAIVKALVEAQGGTIQVETPLGTPPGAGACFTLHFPHAHSAAPPDQG